MTEASTPIHVPLQRIPPEIRCAQDYESLARQFIAGPSYEYIAGGSARDISAKANVAAFDDWAVYPRLLADVRAGHCAIELAGQHYPHPIFLAPVAYQKLVHPAGELDTARAAEAVQSCMMLSTLATQTIEAVAAVAGPRRWFQLYFQPDRAGTSALLERAERAG